MEHWTVDTLKAGLASGSARAYAELYDRLGPALVRAARTMLLSSSEAEDAVQDVFVSLVRSRARLAEVGDVAAYVFASLRHVAGRKAARQAGERKRLKEMAMAGWSDAVDGPREADEELGKAVAELPTEQREVIAMKIDGGLTFAQIGAVLGVSLNTAASRYRYALEKLRERLGRERP